MTTHYKNFSRWVKSRYGVNAEQIYDSKAKKAFNSKYLSDTFTDKRTSKSYLKSQPIIESPSNSKELYEEMFLNEMERSVREQNISDYSVRVLY